MTDQCYCEREQLITRILHRKRLITFTALESFFTFVYRIDFNFSAAVFRLGFFHVCSFLDFLIQKVFLALSDVSEFLETAF